MLLWRSHADSPASQWVSTVITPQFGPDSAYGPETTLDSNFYGDDIEAATSASDSRLNQGLAGLGQRSSGASSAPARGDRVRPKSTPAPAAFRAPAKSAAPAPSAAAVEAGATLSTIGRYAIKGHLGAGGLGQVYQAWDPVLSRAVAVKTVQLNLEPGPRAKQDHQVLTQARAAAGLNHPHIVRVLDAGLSAQGVYIAMERLDGRDMADALARGWRPRPSLTAQIMRHLAEAVAYAHAKGVVHGNIKPTNVFIGRDDQPKLLDFGIAQVARQGWSTDADAAFSSPHYLAPEQLIDGIADRRTDIRALGVVMYELLALHQAFQGDTADQVIQAVLTNQPVPIAQQRRNVPRTLQFIAERAMATDPSQRFTSAHQMATQLRQWSERHVDRKELVSSRAKKRQSTEKVMNRAISPRQVVLALGVALAGLFVLWQYLPTSRLETEPAAVKNQANPEDEILFAKSRSTAGVGGEAQRAAPEGTGTAKPPNTAATRPPVGASESQQRVLVARDDEPGNGVAGATGASAVNTTVVSGAATVATGAAGALSAAGASSAVVAPRITAAAVPESSLKRAAAQEESVFPGSVEVKTGRAASVTTAPGVGAVQLFVSPWGQVEVNGVLVGLTPPMAQLNLPAGKHVITVRSDGFAPHTSSVYVLSNKSVEFRHRFTP
jgi:eukaryotic-like serine/threonine-protein kinase